MHGAATKLRLADDEAMGIQTAHLPVALAPGLIVTLLANGGPLEFVQSIMRGDRYSIILDLSANRAPQATREGATR